MKTLKFWRLFFKLHYMSGKIYENIFKMADIVLYRHVLKYICNKVIESIKLVATVFINKQNIVSVHAAS